VTFEEWVQYENKSDYVQLEFEYFQRKLIIAPNWQAFLGPVYEFKRWIQREYYDVLSYCAKRLHDKNIIELEERVRPSLKSIWKMRVKNKRKKD
jgi:hypothetical protein